MQALLPRFRAAHTQVLGVSVDSVYCHAQLGEGSRWCLLPAPGGFPSRRAKIARSLRTVPGGRRHHGSRHRAHRRSGSGPSRLLGGRLGASENIGELAAECERLDEELLGDPSRISADPPGLPEGGLLYVKSSCGFSRAALLARDNLHLSERSRGEAT